jgi:hypothetical protein
MVNYNVLLTFAQRITDGIATGIWASSVLSTYISVMQGSTDEANEVRGAKLGCTARFAAWPPRAHATWR